jgi:hypothetical protein
MINYLLQIIIKRIQIIEDPKFIIFIGKYFILEDYSQYINTGFK